jgi:hypothetical protein
VDRALPERSIAGDVVVRFSFRLSAVYQLNELVAQNPVILCSNERDTFVSMYFVLNGPNLAWG